MSVLPRLFKLYRSAGYEPLTGFSPYHMGDHIDAPFTRFVHKNKLVGTPGLALQELMFVEGLAEHLRPKTILVIGNALGWSTIALALMFPNSDVLALDPDRGGNALTQRIARRGNLRVRALTGSSPEDVPKKLRVELCLIDAVHTNPCLAADLAAVLPLLSQAGVVLMHDVINWNMFHAFHELVSQNGVEGRLLTRTASGMAIAWKGKIGREAQEYVDIFTDHPRRLSDYRKLLRHFPNRAAEEALRTFERQGM